MKRKSIEISCKKEPIHTININIRDYVNSYPIIKEIIGIDAPCDFQKIINNLFLNTRLRVYFDDQKHFQIHFFLILKFQYHFLEKICFLID